MTETSPTRAGAVFGCGCALALMAAASVAHAEREPAARARALGRAAAQQARQTLADELELVLPDPDEEEPGRDAPPEGQGEAEAGRDSVSDPGPAPDPDSDPESGPESDPGSGPESDPGSGPGSESDRESDSARSVRRAVPPSARRARSPARQPVGTGSRSPRALAPLPARALPPAPAPSEPPGLEHVVAQGETLHAIAAKYGTTLQSLLDQNPGLSADRIREGQHIAIDGERRLARVTVQRGDTLTGIARAQRVTVGELLRWNPSLDPDRVRDGVSLRVLSRIPTSPSASVGSPSAGRLLTGRRLSAGLGFAVRTPDRAWGTDETVRELTAGFGSLQRAFPDTPRVWVHDLSLRSGGPIDDHHSHQSGRDVDIAYVQRECKSGCGFRPLSASELDARRTWTLLRYWLERDALEAVFIDYRLQAPLYRAARASGATAEELLRWFQYPRGRGNPWGVVRHFPKHGDHMHVRFACHPSDPECKSFRPLLTQTARR